MTYLSTNGLPFIEEHEATGEVAQIYDAVKREMQMPFVLNILKAIAASPDMLAFQWEMTKAYNTHLSLPQSLVGMIGYTISTNNNCTYCSVLSELSCRSLGIEEETLDRLVEDLGSVNPQRVQAIIEFALKVAGDPKSLVRSDYDKVRDQGISDEEIVEIIFVSAMSAFLDTLADALQIDVDEMMSQALAGMM